MKSVELFEECQLVGGNASPAAVTASSSSLIPSLLLHCQESLSLEFKYIFHSEEETIAVEKVVDETRKEKGAESRNHGISQ